MNVVEPAPGSGAMFDQIAERYDLLNRIISLGIDQGWRRKTVRALALERGQRVLDLATGTADLAIQIARSHDVEVVGIDPSVNMLSVGKNKVERASLGERVSLLEGDAQRLDFPDDHFDACTMAFGIRNVPDRQQALREMNRVVRPGGRIAILELSEPRSGILGPLARFHIHKVVPWVGATISGRREYAYLQQSIAAFPSSAEFASAMADAGQTVIEVLPLTFGVCCLFISEATSVEVKR